MEKSESSSFIIDAMAVYHDAKNLEKYNKFEEAKEKYQVAARILVEIVSATPKSDKNYKEYKSLAKEILTKAENCKEKSETLPQHSISSITSGKGIK